MGWAGANWPGLCPLGHCFLLVSVGSGALFDFAIFGVCICTGLLAEVTCKVEDDCYARVFQCGQSWGGFTPWP